MCHFGEEEEEEKKKKEWNAKVPYPDLVTSPTIASYTYLEPIMRRWGSSYKAIEEHTPSDVSQSKRMIKAGIIVIVPLVCVVSALVFAVHYLWLSQELPEPDKPTFQRGRQKTHQRYHQYTISFGSANDAAVSKSNKHPRTAVAVERAVPRTTLSVSHRSTLRETTTAMLHLIAKALTSTSPMLKPLDAKKNPTPRALVNITASVHTGTQQYTSPNDRHVETITKAPQHSPTWTPLRTAVSKTPVIANRSVTLSSTFRLTAAPTNVALQTSTRTGAPSDGSEASAAANQSKGVRLKPRHSTEPPGPERQTSTKRIAPSKMIETFTIENKSDTVSLTRGLSIGKRTTVTSAPPGGSPSVTFLSRKSTRPMYSLATAATAPGSLDPRSRTETTKLSIKNSETQNATFATTLPQNGTLVTSTSSIRFTDAQSLISDHYKKSSNSSIPRLSTTTNTRSGFQPCSTHSAHIFISLLSHITRKNKSVYGTTDAQSSSIMSNSVLQTSQHWVNSTLHETTEINFIFEPTQPGPRPTVESTLNIWKPNTSAPKSSSSFQSRTGRGPNATRSVEKTGHASTPYRNGSTTMGDGATSQIANDAIATTTRNLTIPFRPLAFSMYADVKRSSSYIYKSSTMPDESVTETRTHVEAKNSSNDATKSTSQRSIRSRFALPTISHTSAEKRRQHTHDSYNITETTLQEATTSAQTRGAETNESSYGIIENKSQRGISPSEATLRLHSTLPATGGHNETTDTSYPITETSLQENTTTARRPGSLLLTSATSSVPESSVTRHTPKKEVRSQDFFLTANTSSPTFITELTTGPSDGWDSSRKSPFLTNAVSPSTEYSETKHNVPSFRYSNSIPVSPNRATLVSPETRFLTPVASENDTDAYGVFTETTFDSSNVSFQPTANENIAAIGFSRVSAASHILSLSTTMFFSSVLWNETAVVVNDSAVSDAQTLLEHSTATDGPSTPFVSRATTTTTIPLNQPLDRIVDNATTTFGQETTATDPETQALRNKTITENPAEPSLPMRLVVQPSQHISFTPTKRSQDDAILIPEGSSSLTDGNITGRYVRANHTPHTEENTNVTSPYSSTGVRE